VEGLETEHFLDAVPRQGLGFGHHNAKKDANKQEF
jgi:hypothetical protein